MSRTRTSPLTLWLSLIGALVLAVVPLPDVVDAFRPPWVTMAVIYWAMMWPSLCGILTAFIMGLALDLLSGSLLGQHALALSVVAYLTLRFHRQIRNFPLWQLTVTAFMVMAVDAFFVFWADGIAGYPTGGAARWSQVIAGGLLWLHQPFANYLISRGGVKSSPAVYPDPCHMQENVDKALCNLFGFQQRVVVTRIAGSALPKRL